ncbi:MAG: hypothetical protein JWM98_2926, partial [Thermoleophilia bacterium]|nr:hypothetical protein [Thermoleophilia bacterium]
MTMLATAAAPPTALLVKLAARPDFT